MIYLRQNIEKIKEKKVMKIMETRLRIEHLLVDAKIVHDNHPNRLGTMVLSVSE